MIFGFEVVMKRRSLASRGSADAEEMTFRVLKVLSRRPAGVAKSFDAVAVRKHAANALQHWKATHR
jgi:hypothetical protein